jgi:Raf kinase inhibitor-like YbhB/YbcL family protein
MSMERLLKRTAGPNPYDAMPPRPSFTLVSDDLTHGEKLSIVHVHGSAGGDDQSPQLSWRGFPEETRSFAVTVFDPDAPTLCGWWHWFVMNIPADVTDLDRNAGAEGGAGLPRGAVQLRNDYGSFGFGGAGPPKGDIPHRYLVAVHALDTDRIDLPNDIPLAIASFQVTAHTLARAVITCTYEH